MALIRYVGKTSSFRVVPCFNSGRLPSVPGAVLFGRVCIVLSIFLMLLVLVDTSLERRVRHLQFSNMLDTTYLLVFCWHFN